MDLSHFALDFTFEPLFVPHFHRDNEVLGGGEEGPCSQEGSGIEAGAACRHVAVRSAGCCVVLGPVRFHWLNRAGEARRELRSPLRCSGASFLLRAWICLLEGGGW